MTLRDVPMAHSGGLISLRLLDATHGHSVQSWKFEHPAAVSIGRLEENDVVLADPVVSRLHATINKVDGRWELNSLGKNGVLINDRRVERVELRHEMMFRLGPNGPMLQFVQLDRAAPQESQVNCTTTTFDPTMLDLLGVDEERAAEQVKEIIENDDFQRLLGRARELREKRVSGED